ncbi:unnamed protein product [Sphenostylis stenocarpa]|uniref:Uncharacterized protein n=1 Tax=Sphenostylis stenocarpa TaxID=92480 RepID=A0AA86VF50_9FABA|nr:unnamed protein product [Sphenostylis stenocarpa]
METAPLAMRKKRRRISSTNRRPQYNPKQGRCSSSPPKKAGCYSFVATDMRGYAGADLREMGGKLTLLNKEDLRG